MLKSSAVKLPTSMTCLHCGPCPALIPQAAMCSVLHWLDCAPQYTQSRFCQQDAKSTQASSDGHPREHKSTNPHSQRVDLFQRPPPLFPITAAQSSGNIFWIRHWAPPCYWPHTLPCYWPRNMGPQALSKTLMCSLQWLDCAP